MDSSSSIYHSLQIATKTGGKEGLGGALMAGNEEKVPLAGDWASVHPSAQNMSSSFIGGVAPPEMKLPTGLAGSAEEEEDSGRGASWEPSSEVKPPRDPRFEPRAGLAERMAVRTGFNAPTLNTDRIRSGNVGSFSSEAQSPFVTIPPGLSPTSFLDSPVFVSNSLAQPSPTTGKLELDQPRNPSGGSAASPSDSFAFNHLNANNNSVAPPMDLTSKAPMQLGSSNPESPSVGDLSDSLMGDELAENQHDGEGENRGESTLLPAGVQSEDGYNWRKYGQKQVKGSEFPRSYYKCTHPNCQVKKKVERSLEGVTTEITYQGAHNHPKPTLQSRRLAVGPGLLAETVDSLSVPDERAHAPEGILFEAAGGSDLPSNLTNEEEDDEQGGGVEEDELESKRRRMDLASMEMGGASRAVREPRVVVQTTSEVDILDDGYRWRKYGQKVVKGNPNPRSYYKCTNPGCTVRKHVERASHDLKSVITTYEGKHNHDVPAARSSNQSSAGQSSSGNSSGAAVPPAHRRPLQGLPSFDGPPLPPPPLPLGSFAPAGFPLVGQSAMWTLHNGNGWPGSYHPHEDPAAAASQFGSGPAPLEGGWYRESQG